VALVAMAVMELRQALAAAALPMLVGVAVVLLAVEL
jgi:hypothetical protein